MSFTTIAATTLGLADGDQSPTPVSGTVRITPRHPAGTIESGGVIATGPVIVTITGGEFPSTDVPAREDSTGLIEFHLYTADGPVRMPDTEIPLTPGTTIDLRDHIPAAVDPATGEALARGPAGPSGASVVGGRDNGDGTVSFELSDGTYTDPVTVPPGPAGRGIVTVTGDGPEATIEFTDGTATTVPLPAGEDGHSPVLAWDGSRLTVDGIPGPDLTGPEGPAPSVEWSGAHLVVGGVEGPDLTGPSGPTPSVSWDGAHLVVGGVQGPDLTGPQGVPGTVPTAADYMVVGPGRPDAPTTTGMTSAALDALPVGAEYRSTDGASVGAWVWRKRPTGWRVIDGDTGWLSISLGEPYPTGATIRVRRTTELVYAAHGTPQMWTQWNPGVAKTSGVATNKTWNSSTSFMPDNRAIALIHNGDTGAVVGSVGWSTEGNGFVGLTHTATTGMVFELQAACTRPWPTTLPGTAV